MMIDISEWLTQKIWTNITKQTVDTDQTSSWGNIWYITMMDWHSDSVVERPICDWEVVGSIPGWVIPKTLK